MRTCLLAYTQFTNWFTNSNQARAVADQELRIVENRVEPSHCDNSE